MTSPGSAPPAVPLAWERPKLAWLRSDWAFVLAAFALALGLRVAAVLAFAEQPMWDGHFYHVGATRIAEGHGYSEDAVIDGKPKTLPWSHYPVGYSALLAGAYRLFGSGELVAPLTNALFGALLLPFVFAFARHALGARRARAAALLVALHPGLILYSALLMTEPLAAFVVLLSAYFALIWGARRWAPLGAGTAVALSAFLRPQSLFVAPLLCLLFPGSALARLRQTLLSLLVAACVIAPWTYRNCRVLDGCALISTNGGWNLAIGALSETGRFRALTPSDGCADVITPVEQDRCWARVGWERIKRDPLAWLAHIPDKLRHTYNHESFAVAYLAEANPGYWGTDRKYRAMNYISAFHHALMLAAAFAGIARFDWRLWRKHTAWAQAALALLLVGFTLYAVAQPERPMFWVGVFLPLIGLLRLPQSPPLGAALAYLYCVVAATSLTHMIFFGDDRYHLAVTPTLCLLAAAALRRPASSSEQPSASHSPAPADVASLRTI